MKTKASIVVMSHLSDIEFALGCGSTNVRNDIEFVKYIILYCKGDLNKEIDADQLYEKFFNR